MGDVGIDVVITTFNRKGVVGRAIDSALSALVDNVIVVDDASTDGTLKFLIDKYRANKKVHIHRCKKYWCYRCKKYWF